MGGFLSSVILLGAIQGFIVSALLFISARRQPAGAGAKRVLAVIILLMAMACPDIWLNNLPGYLSSAAGNLLNAIIPLIVVMPLGPLIYFYVRSCLEPEFRITRRHRRHFYSVAIDLFQHAAAIVYIILLIAGVLSPNKNY